jgi:plasmid segregation protein ParM
MSSFKSIDAGNYQTKYYDGVKLRKFPSEISLDHRIRRLVSEYGEHSFEWEYAGKKGFAGTLAEEAECGGSIGGDTKAHFDAKLRILIALHQFSNDNLHNIIVGQPISTHTPEAKSAIKEQLIGRHEITINGEMKNVIISRCEVAAEGVVAGLLCPANGILRIMDVGSATINYGTLKDRRFLDRDSWTVPDGMETFRERNYEAIGRKLASNALQKWKRGDRVLVSGGGANYIFNYVKDIFTNAELIEDPIFANVKAFYMIGRKVYG